MQNKPSAEQIASRRAKLMGAAAVSMVLCIALAVIAMINDNMPLAGVLALLAVGSHLLLWRLINQGHREKEAAERDSD